MLGEGLVGMVLVVQTWTVKTKEVATKASEACKRVSYGIPVRHNSPDGWWSGMLKISSVNTSVCPSPSLSLCIYITNKHIAKPMVLSCYNYPYICTLYLMSVYRSLCSSHYCCY